MAEPHSSRPPPNRRRDKPQLSCNLCRKRKLKCDRIQPCGTCSRHGLEDSCIFQNVPPNVDLNQARTTVSGPGRAANIPDRIKQLEHLVTTLASSGGSSNTTQSSNSKPHENENLQHSLQHNTNQNEPTRDIPELAESVGRISLQNGETSYVDNTHWTAILDNIEELKSHLQADPIQNRLDANSAEPDMLFGHYKRISQRDILASLPPRFIADHLVAEYFQNKTVTPIIIHRPTFLREYDRFWSQPLDTPVMWVGQLFGVLSLGAYYQYEPLTAVPNPQSLIPTYREKLIQCLVLGQYAKCPSYTIETLLLQLHLEYSQNENSQIEFQTMLGVIIRLALRMGYHRDASHFPHMTVFQGEMRRRVWAMLISLDALASAQVGLPRMIRESHCDTAIPQNFLDEDLYEAMLSLPTPQPDTVETPIQFLNAKNTITAIYSRISDTITAIKPAPYIEIMLLDKYLVDTYTSVPQVLQMPPRNDSLAAAPGTILHRISIAILFHKSKCILHYRYMKPSQTDIRFQFSRQACVKSSLEILEYQVILDEETKPGGKLHQERWKLSNFIKTAFFLATSLLCVEVTNISVSEREAGATDITPKDKILKALHKSYLIWLKSQAQSREAQKAAEVLRAVLRNCQVEDLEQPNDTARWVENAAEVGITDAGIGRSDPAIWLFGPPNPEQIRAFQKATPGAPPATVHQLLRADVDYSDTPAEAQNLTQSLEEILGISSFSPSAFYYPMQ